MKKVKINQDELVKFKVTNDILKQDCQTQKITQDKFGLY